MIGARVGVPDMPGIRDGLVRSFEGGSLVTMLREHKAGGRHLNFPSTLDYRGRARPWGIEEYNRNLVRWLQVADLYYVNTEMTALIKHAAEKLPPYRMYPEDPPSKVGLVIFDQPICVITSETTAAPGHPDPMRPGTTVHIRGALWAPCNTGVKDATNIRDYLRGQHIVLFGDSDVLLASERFQQGALASETRERMRASMGPFYYHDEAPLPYGEINKPVTNTALGAVMSTWLIASQKIAATERATLPRQMRRTLARAGKPEPVIRTITLRRIKTPSRVGEEIMPPSGRQAIHRWYVDGYWAEHWFPSLNRHKLIWRSPSVRGPEGAPFLEGTKVYAVKR